MPRAPRPADLDDLRVGVLSSGDAAADDVLDDLVAKLARRHFLGSVIRRSRPDARTPLPDGSLVDLARDCDVVVLGVCSDEAAVSVAVRDAGSLEQRAVPCAVLLSASALTASAPPDSATATGSVCLVPVPDDQPAGPAGQRADRSYLGVERCLYGPPAPGLGTDVLAPSGGTEQGIVCEC